MEFINVNNEKFAWFITLALRALGVHVNPGGIDIRPLNYF